MSQDRKLELGDAGSARYDQIIATAVDLFERQGYGATSLAEIADAVGIRKATLYYYLDSKVELLQAVYDRVTDQLREVIRRSSPEKEPCERLVEIIDNHVDFHVRHGSFVRIVWAERYELPPDMYDVVRSREREYEDFVRATLEEGISRRCLAGYEPDLLTSGLLGLLTTVYRWPRGGREDAVFHAGAVSLVTRFVLGPTGACRVHALAGTDLPAS